MVDPSIDERNELLGNMERAGAIFAEYGDFIRATIHRQTSSKGRADDLLQNFFLALVRKPVPANVKNVRRYMYRAITNDVVDAVRRAGKYRNLIEKYSRRINYTINNSRSEDAIIEQEARDKMFERIRKRLPQSEGEAITLRYRDNYSIGEIARKMGVKKRSVSSYLSVGLKRLRRHLTGNKDSQNDCTRTQCLM